MQVFKHCFLYGYLLSVSHYFHGYIVIIYYIYLRHFIIFYTNVHKYFWSEQSACSTWVAMQTGCVSNVVATISLSSLYLLSLLLFPDKDLAQGANFWCEDSTTIVELKSGSKNSQPPPPFLLGGGIRDFGFLFAQIRQRTPP